MERPRDASLVGGAALLEETLQEGAKLVNVSAGDHFSHTAPPVQRPRKSQEAYRLSSCAIVRVELFLNSEPPSFILLSIAFSKRALELPPTGPWIVHNKPTHAAPAP